MRIFSYDELSTADLVVDAVYEGFEGRLAAEPISKLLPGCGNMGGFRFSGRGKDKLFVVLFTTGEDKDWPDLLDLNLGQFVYYGDNKEPGHLLHQTHKGGNRILRRVYELLHSNPPSRSQIPPFFIFSRYPTAASARSMQFSGIAIPGYPGIPATQDLVAVWKTSEGQRFQNYRAVFSILDIPVVPRAWLNSFGDDDAMKRRAPEVWKEWVKNGRCKLLTSDPTTIIRSAAQQTPDTPLKTGILRTVFEYFRRNPFLFEHFAARIFQLQDQRVNIDEVTRGVVDGGRDAIGRYRLGLTDDPVYAEFALEAKCFAPPIDGHRPNTVGVKAVARLISRLRHRQFGVLVTTSIVARQAYQEVREDRHPIIFISGKDISETLIAAGYNSIDSAKVFLETEFPRNAGEGNR